MSKEFAAILVGRWTTGYDKKRKNAIIKFDFSDREPLVFAMSVDEAKAMGTALANLHGDATKPRH